MTHHDLAIIGATIVDGTGSARFAANVYVTGDAIAAVSPPGRVGSATEIVEAKVLILAPGFIDVHTHDDMAFIHTPEFRSKTSQGVTTVITGLCGYSAAPLPHGVDLPQEYDILIPEGGQTFPRFGQYLDAVASAAPAPNWLPLVGHSSLRIASMTRLDRHASQQEQAEMARAFEAALDDGAAGLSSGLAYSMAKAASTDELVDLCRVMAPRRLPYVTHVRDEGDRLVEAVEEALQVGRSAGVTVILSHHKALGGRNHGKVEQTLGIVDSACRCQSVGLDVYPYAYSSTSLTPERAARGGEIIITRSVAMPEAVGRTLESVAAELECDQIEAARRLQPAGALYFLMDEDDVRRVLRHPLTMIGSDGLPFDGQPHPRLWGTFPRVLGRYVRDSGILTLEAAIHKMTGLSASMFGLDRRGLIRPGHFADLVLFDPAEIVDQASPSDPTARSEGIRDVWVNGRRTSRGTGRRLSSQHNG